MKKSIIYFSFLNILFCLCRCENKANNANKTEDADTVVVLNLDTSYKKPLDASAILIDTNLIKAQVPIINEQISLTHAIKNVEMRVLAVQNLSAQISDFDRIIDVKSASTDSKRCSFPSSIKDLTDGISLQSYDFKKGDSIKLGLLGFLNVDYQNDEKITVVEFAQTKNTICDDKTLNYGIGARLMLRIKKRKKGAKLETAQQITASVIFQKAEVNYSVKTFGIVGPGTAKLIKSGTLSENTYNDFINAIADIIVGAYKTNSADFIITPIYMPLKQ